LNENCSAGVFIYSKQQLSNHRRFLMQSSRWLVTCLLLAFSAPVAIRAQGTAAPQAPESAKKESEASTPIKLQIVLSDSDGTQKLTSLPYSLSCVAGTGKPGGPCSSMRIGVKVPVTTATKAGDSEVQYIDVGTSIDARAARVEDGRFWVDMTVDRSSLYIAAQGDGKVVGKNWSDGEAPPSHLPVVRQSRGSIGTFLREGQATEASVATDPLTGHVLKVELTLTVVK
jgi:hypothetical protein